mmetsp:Transcript_19272/g.45056  ORF Transcript_19272/g.45056 Transcript_19272/m.45056 type:complete len:182 (-) Transcript_19272:38-583(-)
MVGVSEILMGVLGIPRAAIAPVLISILSTSVCTFFFGWMFSNYLTEEIVQKEPSTLHFVGKAYQGEDVKMVLCVRGDLKMKQGKVASQVGHAAVGLYKRMSRAHIGVLGAWEQCGQPKVALRIEDELELKRLRNEARARGLATFVVEDAGMIQAENGCKTVLAMLGPNSAVDEVTGDLKLY